MTKRRRNTNPARCTGTEHRFNMDGVLGNWDPDVDPTPPTTVDVWQADPCSNCGILASEHFGEQDRFLFASDWVA